MISVPPFRKTYARRCVLDFPGFAFEPGKIYCVIGANGSGKSTFARILSGSLTPDQHRKILTCSVGYMPQKSFAFRMSTRANLLLKTRDLQRADQLLDAFHLRALADKRADRLSGGETARMALARLMMSAYDLVILDEPTAAMDMEMTLIAEEEIRNYTHRTGCALILVTHSLQQANRLADGVLFFHKGQLAESGTSRMLHAPAQDSTKAFLNFYGIG